MLEPATVLMDVSSEALGPVRKATHHFKQTLVSYLLRVQCLVAAPGYEHTDNDPSGHQNSAKYNQCDKYCKLLIKLRVHRRTFSLKKETTTQLWTLAERLRGNCKNLRFENHCLLACKSHKRVAFEFMIR